MMVFLCWDERKMMILSVDVMEKMREMVEREFVQSFSMESWDLPPSCEIWGFYRGFKVSGCVVLR